MKTGDQRLRRRGHHLLGGFDYHDGTRATGETTQLQGRAVIGACLEYAKRKW